MWGTLRQVGLSAVAGLVAAALTTPVASANELELSMNNGHVTIRATDTLISEILAEWGRIGNTAIIDANVLSDRTVTIELVDVPEARALRTLLRTAGSYMAAPRAVMSDGVSRFDRIMILATSTPVAGGGIVTSPARVAAPTQTIRGTVGQRLGVVPSAPRGQTPFTVSPAQQEQLDQLQRLLRQGDDAQSQPPRPVETQSTFGSIPAARPGMPMGNADPNQETARLRTAAFGTVDGPTGAFGSTPVTDPSGRSRNARP